MKFNGKYRLPTVGMRNLKTALAAALCALAYYFLDRSPAFACIGAIFGMGADMEDSRRNGGNRLFGTMIGGLLGMALFRIYLLVHPDGESSLLLVPLVFVGTVLLIILCQIFWVGGVQPGGVKSAAGIMLIVAATQAFGWVITRAGIPQTLAQSFTSSITNPLVFVFAVCVILLVAGCFIDAVPALLIFAPIFCPTADAYGINMIYFGVVMVIVLCIGLATPPVGINLYVASSVGGQPVHKIIPHLPIPLLAIFVGTVIVILVPEIITFLPNVL